MSILNYLPAFKVLENRRSTGLVIGHVLSQFLADIEITTKTINGKKYIENGIIVGLSDDLTIGNFDLEKHSIPFIVFNEELNTFMAGLKYFAQEVEDETYPRAIGLYVGDVFVTNNYSGTLNASAKYAKVVDGVLTLQTTADEYTMFTVAVDTLPTGELAGLFSYIGINQAQIADIWDEITFDLNGGTWDGEQDDVKVMGVQGYPVADYALDPIPTNPGYYYFDGWYYDLAGTQPIGVDLLEEDITVYAKWTPINYGINYVFEESHEAATNTNPVEYNVETATITLVAAVLEGFDFDGWFAEDTYVTAVTEIPLGSHGEITLYAKFTENI